MTRYGKIEGCVMMSGWDRNSIATLTGSSKRLNIFLISSLDSFILKYDEILIGFYRNSLICKVEWRPG